MKALKADHFAFQVSDLDKSIAFYSSVLGMKLMFREVDEEHQEAFAFFELEGGNLELLQSLKERQKSPIQERNSTFCPHLAINVESLDQWIEYLKEKEIKIEQGPLLISEQVTWMYITDPDGNVIEFVEWLK